MGPPRPLPSLCPPRCQATPRRAPIRPRAAPLPWRRGGRHGRPGPRPGSGGRWRPAGPVRLAGLRAPLPAPQKRRPRLQRRRAGSRGGEVFLPRHGAAAQLRARQLHAAEAGQLGTPQQEGFEEAELVPPGRGDPSGGAVPAGHGGAGAARAATENRGKTEKEQGAARPPPGAGREDSTGGDRLPGDGGGQGEEHGTGLCPGAPRGCGSLSWVPPPCPRSPAPPGGRRCRPPAAGREGAGAAAGPGNRAAPAAPLGAWPRSPSSEARHKDTGRRRGPMAAASKGGKAKAGGVRFAPSQPAEGAPGHVHFQEQLRDSAVMVTQEKDGHFLVKVGFLKILHKYEIAFLLPPSQRLGKDVCALPLPNPNLRVLSVTSGPEGYSIKCEYTAHKEGVLKEEMLLASETGDGAGLKVVVQARVMDRHHGTPMLLEGVRCVGAELEYDSEQSDWHGFD
ncbi:uncharacterized protein ADISSP [Anas platyrhynchos]|uniref:uncharacterized protein ADISSP n=1 Tax=Anas platyrhynchos TaxID=8839 RepID=UPI003AF29566